MDTMIESKLESLQNQISALEAKLNQCADWELQLETESWSFVGYEIQYNSNNTRHNVPIQSSLTLPKGLKAETVSGSTIITQIEKPNYSIDKDSFNNISTLFFEFFLATGAMICLALFMYYVRHFLFYFVFPKK